MIVRVTYHQEAEGVWADSADVDGWTAAGGNLGEVRELVHDGLPFYLDLDSSALDLREEISDSAATVVDLSYKADFGGVHTGSFGSSAGTVIKTHLTRPNATLPDPRNQTTTNAKDGLVPAGESP